MLRKWFKFIEDRNLDLQERLFRLLVLIGLCGLTAGMVDEIVIRDDITSIILLAVVFVFFVGVFFCSLRFHKIQQGAIIIAITLIFVVLPVIFLTAGGIYGGAPLWFLFGVIYVCLVVEGKVKYVFTACSFIVNAACYYIAYRYPSLVSRHTTETAYIDSGVSLLIVASLICIMILFQNRIYRSENSFAKKQIQEIEALNQAQNRFFSGMSHEIRTPINTIIGMNEMILREDVPDKVAADAINIQGASKMLLALINDFLDMSRIESGKMNIVPNVYDVGAMLSDIVNMIWVRAKEKGLAFHVDVERSVPAQLIGDEVRIKQVLINLLNNAVKYTESGSVTLSIRSREYEPNRVKVTYSITDTGMGIKQENIPHLFSAFQRVDEERTRYIEGTGLGLSIVKQLVDLMNGDIVVKSVYTEGSTFVITLPQELADEDKIGDFNPKSRQAVSAREHYKQSFEAPKAHVLIADDNEMNLLVTAKLLRDTKVQIDTATSGAECLKRTLQRRYDVILLDYLMHDMDGVSCLHVIRTQTGGLNQNTPTVMLTANAGEENQALYRNEGVDGYLLKPTSGRQLEAELLRLLPGELVNMTSADDLIGVFEAPAARHKRTLPIVISTDNVCDLPENLVAKYPIAIMPFRLHIESGEFLDGIEAEADGILSYMSERGKEVRSVAPAVSDYEDFFAKQLTKAQYVIHIATAKNVSSGYAHSLEASKAFDNVSVVDSGHLSSGMGLMVLRAASYAASGMSAEALLRKIEEMKEDTSSSFVVSSTKYLARSGRILSKVDGLCNALMLHPVITLKQSTIKVGNFRSGTIDHVRSKYIASMLKFEEEIDTRVLFITYAGLTKEELEGIKEQVQRKVKFQNIICQKASSAISTHCGPGTFGLFFMINKNF